MTFWDERPIDWTLPLSRDEVVRRIRAATDPDRLDPLSWSSYGGSKPVVGAISGNTFWLRARPAHANAYAPRLEGTIEESNGRLRIHARYRMERRVKLITLTFLLAPLLLSIIVTLVSGASASIENVPGLAAITALLLLLVGLARWRTRDPRKLRAFMEDLLPEAESHASNRWT